MSSRVSSRPSVVLIFTYLENNCQISVKRYLARYRDVTRGS